jgi:hypothetical protein
LLRRIGRDKHSSLLCRGASDLEKRQALKGLFKTNNLAYFAATSVTTVRRHSLKGFDMTKTLAYFVEAPVT